MMGLEEHLIGMFRHDFEFVEGHRSHLSHGAPAAPSPRGASTTGDASSGESPAMAVAIAEPPAGSEPVWTAEGEAELNKIPFFVRGKVRRNTETFARDRGLACIDAEALYDAKAFYSR
jgi:light-independent protochlorophyllide reductase subunit B